MKKVVFFVFASYCGVSLFGQAASSGVDIFSQVSAPSNGGKIVVYQDAKVKELVNRHIESNGQVETIDGYRIQLYSGSSKMAKSEALMAKSKFLGMFPDVSVYLEYNAPFWRVRAGDFRSKNESMELYSKVKPAFPESYPVKDLKVYYNRISPPLN